MGRLAERTAVRLAIFAVIATALVWTILPTAGWLNEYRDAQVLTLHERAAVDSVLRFGQVPLWNPWYCGGVYALGEPQSRFASPPFLLSVLFGAERAEPLVVFLFAVLGMEGTYRWLRLRVNDAFAVLRIAPIFALSGHFSVSYFRGWINFFGFELVPFVLFGITLAARGRTAGIAVAAIAFAVMMGFGATFAAPIVAVAAVIEAIRAFAEQPPGRRVRALVMLGALASFMTALAAFRLVPLAETLSAQPRIMAGTPGHTPKTLLYFLTGLLEVKDGDVGATGSFFVGAAFLALVALGGSDRKSIRPLAVFIVFVWLAAGYARKPSLFALLRELPVFAALRYPERFLWVAILYASEPAAYALSRLPRLGDGKGWRVGANVVLTLAVLVTIGSQVIQFANVSKSRELGVVAVRRSDQFRQARGNRWLAAHYEGLGAGSLSCWETHPITMSSKLRGDLAAEEYVSDPRTGTARRVTWSPNELVVHASMSSAGTLVVNQNWHPGWRASVGSVVSYEGLLAVELPPGEHDVTLRFRPRSSLVGAAVSLVALVSLLMLGVGIHRGRIPFRRGTAATSAALVVAPWAVFGGAVATWNEPRFPPPRLENANGSPALVAAPSSDAVKLDAKFELPIVVEAVRFAGPDRWKNVMVDLYLRRTGRLSRTTGMFVHIVRRDRQGSSPEPANTDPEKETDFFNADHQVVGGSFFLSDSPKGMLVHDAFGAHVGNAIPGEYDVWLAFGHVSGRRGRAKVVDPGVAIVSEDSRIRIGSFVVR
ncbi:MAG TPA: hypothetical protein VM580_30280 [Labilithrix sp.]|nr:hypothetical protein [Labilithrix sp.]